VRPRADQVLFARTRDRWRIALHHWRPLREEPGAREPVLLCHGLAATASTWDLGHGPSLARWLASRGHRVYALELRGSGDSDRPRLGGARTYEWGLHEYVALDVPAAIDAVLEHARSDRLHWIGHSMGGILLLAIAATEVGKKLRSAITVASSIDYSVGSDFSRFKSVAGLLRLVRAIPVGTAARFYAPLASASILDDFMFAPENLTRAEKRAIWDSCFTWIPGKLLRELATTFDPGGFRGRDGVAWKPRLARMEVPLLALSGSRDRQCSPRMVDATLALVGGPKQVVHLAGLGHFDLLIGARAEREVYPVIADWIERERPA
jgi:pimeloyl-ACP methyl ester carboxylesterase